MPRKKSGWTVGGAVNTLLDAPTPTGDTVFVLDYKTFESARKFLEKRYSNNEIKQLLAWGQDRREGRPLREF